MKRITTIIFLLTFWVNSLFSQKDTLFGVYTDQNSFGYLNLKPDSTFEYLNQIDVGPRIKTTGSYYKIGNEIIIKYKASIYPEFFEIKDSFDDKIDQLKIKILFVDSCGQIISNSKIENEMLYFYQHKSDYLKDTSKFKRLNENGVGYINDLQADSIFILPIWCTPIIYPRIDKSKNYYIFKITLPSPRTMYYLIHDKLYFDKGLIYFNNNKEGTFWYNSTLYKSRKSLKKVYEMYDKGVDSIKNSR